MYSFSTAVECLLFPTKCHTTTQTPHSTTAVEVLTEEDEGTGAITGVFATLLFAVVVIGIVYCMYK